MKGGKRPIWIVMLRMAAVALNVSACAMMVFAAYGGTIPPDRSTLGALAAMVFPGMLMFVLLLTVANLIWWRPMAVLNILSVAVCVSPILTFCPMNFSRPSMESLQSDSAGMLDVVTYNMYGLEPYGSTGDSVDVPNRTLEYVIDRDADMVLCQESVCVDGPAASRVGVTVEQREKLRSRYPYRYVNKRGMGILSKYPFRHVPLHYGDEWQFDVCRYDVSVGDGVVHVFNLHLQSIGLTDDDKALYRKITDGKAEGEMTEIRRGLIGKLSAAFRARARQARLVREYVDSLQGSVIVCGDFNDIPGCYAARIIAGDDLKDAYREAGLGPAVTYHADRFYFRIDQILFRGDMRPERVWRDKWPTSDHYPLQAVFRLSGDLAE